MTIDLPAPRSGRTPLPGAASWRTLLAKAVDNRSLAAVDQVIVSGTAFVSLIMVARWTDVAQLGYFAVGTSLVGVALTLQHALVSLPYTIKRHEQPELLGERTFASLLQSLGIGLALTCAFAFVASCGAALGAAREAVILALGLAFLIPLALLRELARDYLFARMDMARALLLDVAVALPQLVLLAAFTQFWHLSLSTAFAAMAVAHVGPVIVWLVAGRTRFSVSWSHALPFAKEAWQLGKWFSVSQAAILVQGYATYWLSMLVAGAAVTGVYAACISIVAFANPVLFGLYNYMAPRAVAVWTDGGTPLLMRHTAVSAALLGGLMAVFCAALYWAGEPVMELLYPGPEYVGHGTILVLFGGATLFMALGIPASNALATMQRPRPVAATAVGSAVLCVVLVWWMMSAWGLAGAAYAVALAALAGTVGRWLALLMAVRPEFGWRATS